MSNLDKYNNAFIETFNISSEQLDEMHYHGVSTWDSVGHMRLIAAIEDFFNLMLEPEDIIGFTSYKKGKEILSKKEYGVTFDE